ncbi:MAG TPA: phosphodiester glycosidase family protein [Acidimicrobiales bacterium]|nr:phosphodiester glycosidase family protein [Acidimicrobiales bacterium]
MSRRSLARAESDGRFTRLAELGAAVEDGDVGDPGAGAGEPPGAPDGTGPGRRAARTRARSPRRRRVRNGILLVLAALLAWVGVSLGSALANPMLGNSVSARGAEWVREHGGSSIVNWIENEWYRHHGPKVGGAPPAGAIKQPTSPPAGATSSRVPHLPEPKPIAPFVAKAIAGEGEWSPAGRLVDGVPAVYETTLRPDAVHTSYVVGVAWMDTKLLRATLYSGSEIPGGGPYTHTAPVLPLASQRLVAAFNAGFLMSSANGGYYTDGKTIIPLRNGAASFVVYKNGSAAVGSWGATVSMTPSVVSVRQNLDLLVEHGKPVAGLTATTTTRWGATLGNAVFVWRSGLGITANGALVYVGGPGLNITDLADILARAGCVRAMELDINTTWVNLTTYTPATPNGQASDANGTELLPQMQGTPARYFQDWWARDFITMSAAPPRRAS